MAWRPSIPASHRVYSATCQCLRFDFQLLALYKYLIDIDINIQTMVPKWKRLFIQAWTTSRQTDRYIQRQTDIYR